MKLHWSPRSPFVRKVMIVLHETNLLDRVERVRSVVAYAALPNEDVLKDNPLGKIPTLVLDDGAALFDSRVICEYLDGLHGGKRLFPEEEAGRFQQLRWLSLADGLTDVLLLWRTERMRPGGPYDVLTSAFERKVRACLSFLEADAGALSDADFGIGQIAIICAIAQLDFRYQDSGWERSFPALSRWNAAMRQRPSVAATEVRDDSSPAVAGNTEDSISPFQFEAV